MVRLSIIWRNPNRRRTVRCWTNVRRDARHSLYLILESGANGPSAWRGLPTLEVVRGKNSAKRLEDRAQFLTGA